MIRVENLEYRYQKARENAVDNISFEIAQGEIFGFLGPSGAGKSTTQKILIGLLQGYDGQVQVLGKKLNEWDKSYYENIGVSFELPSHFQKLTGLENLQFFGSLYGGELEDSLHLLDLVGLKEDAHKKVANYSKGMQMRLNFARALLNKPKLLFLDEPTSGMDPVNAKNIKDLVLRVKEKGSTVFLTTHNMAIAEELCDRVAFIVEGKIVLIDSPRKLKIEQGERAVTVTYLTGSVSEHEDFPLEGLAGNIRFLEILRKEKVQTIHTKESTLEDIFIRVTGRNLQ